MNERKQSGKTCPNRREVLQRGGVLGAVTIIASSGIPLRAWAQDSGSELPRLSPEAPSAQALSYVHDAQEAETRENQEAFCYNCRYFRGDQSTQWAECQIFPGMAVNADGWCSAWILKPA